MKDNLFDLASKLNAVKVVVDTKEIPFEDILEIEIHWDCTTLEVPATITLRDNRDLISFFTSFNKNKVEIFFTDSDSETCSREFYIADMKEAKGDEENTKTIIIDLIDIVSFTLKNTYISKGYSGKKLSDIMEDIFTIYKIDDLYNKEYTTRTFSSTTQVHDAIVIPGDRPIYDFFEYQMNHEGYLWYQDKKGINFKFIEEIYPSKLVKVPEMDFAEDIENPNYKYKILEMSADFSDAYKNLKHPALTSYVYDSTVKKMKKLQANIVELWDKLKTSDVDEKYIQSTDGICFGRIEDVDHIYALAKETYFFYIENASVEIFVPGKNTNKLLEKRGASFKGSSLHIAGMTEGNTILGGDYIVTSIHDKILGDKMIQKILLGRFNNTGRVQEKGTTNA
jgi:hypothetical protein